MSNGTDWGFWTFVATAAYAVVAYFQWKAIKRQADLTDSSVHKTAEAVAAANRNATAAFESAHAATASVELLRGQTDVLKSQLKAAEDAAIAAKDNASSAKDNAAAAHSSASIAADSLAMAKVMERAYVTMSHSQPGIVTAPAQAAIMVNVQIMNRGNTPADILHVDWQFCGSAEEVAIYRLQPPPPPTAPIRQIVLPKSEFGIWKHASFQPLEFNKITNGLEPLFVVGTVTYLDRLDKRRHRHFYARRFLHEALPHSANNLVFTDDIAYNYEEDLD
jgi:hypothetical protein